MKLKIAVTGGIGSGKSAVLKYISQAGYPTFSCDELYKEILSSPGYIKKIAERFPICITNGQIDKSKLATIVFKDKKERDALNAIAHPMVMKALYERMEECDNVLVFAEVPLLFEGEFQSQFDRVIVVLRNKAERISSLMLRDGLLLQEVEDRILAQFDYDGKSAQKVFEECNAIIVYNNQSEEDLKKQIQRILDTMQ